MALSVPSRFAVLKIEDDDYRPKSTNNKTVNKNKKTENENIKNKKPSSNVNVKISKPIVKSNVKNLKQSKNKKKESDDWEKWKEKDMQLVDGNFETDLENAILLSKLDFEENKELYKKNQLEYENAQKTKETNVKKNKKKKAMSLEQFNNMMGNGDNKEKSSKVQIADESFDMNDSFFEKINSEVKEELQREMGKHLRKSTDTYNDIVTMSQFQAELEKQRAENLILRQELEAARADIINVKSRNKKLCSILGQGEMRDKAEVLLEVERLTRVQAELTAEVERLHGLLEQERSKVGALVNDPKHRDKNKKNHQMILNHIQNDHL